MKILVVFILAISAVNSFDFEEDTAHARHCFERSEMDCMENFVDAVFHSTKSVDECRELRKLVDCSTDAVDECFGDERNHEVDRGLEELENLSRDKCGEVSSGDDSDFDEETYSHIQFTATFKKKKKKASHSTTGEKKNVRSDSKKCFGERKKICWDTFEDAVIHSVFFSSTGLDKCSVLQYFVICARTAANDCFEDEHDEDADEVLEVWENKSNEFCEASITDDQSVPIRPTEMIPIPIEGLNFNVNPTDCINSMILHIGKPVYHRVSTEEIGAWFRDAMPTDQTEDKYYLTFAEDTNHLYEYNSRNDFLNHKRGKIHELPFPFVGRGHLVYKGSFYYHEAKSQMLARFQFTHPLLFHSASQIKDSSYNDEHYLYSSGLEYMDVMADENGVWVVYSAKDTNNTLVRQLDPYTLATKRTWNLTFPHRSVGEMFIACGVLYAVDSVTEPTTRIGFAFDLYQNRTLEVNIPFWNPFKSNFMIAYNPKYRELFTLDKDNQIVYPVEFGNIDPR